jgi:hypothetical protein
MKEILFIQEIVYSTLTNDSELTKIAKHMMKFQKMLHSRIYKSGMRRERLQNCNVLMA